MYRRLILSACLALSVTLASADNLKYVNLFMGTSGDHGQVTPAAQLPYGLVSVCPDSTPGWHGGYDYAVPLVSGVSVTRVSGTGGNGGGGNLSVRPARKETPLNIVKGTEQAVPGYYSTEFDNGVSFQATVTRNVAVEQYVFPADAEKVMYVDFDSAIDHRRSECSYSKAGGNAFEGWVKSSTVCNFGQYQLFFRMETDVPFEVVESDAKTALIRFPESTKAVELRVALSPIDEKTAGEELELASGLSFSKIRKTAYKTWKDRLSCINIKCSNEEQKYLFYTSMYRVHQSPMDCTSHDGRYRATDGQVYKVEDGHRYYSSWSMWDTYRTKFPMLCILDPETMSDMCWSLSQLYAHGKMNWATMAECCPTVRTEHSQVAMLDAWAKGVRGFDMSVAFPAMEQEVVDGMVPGSRQGLTRNSPDQKMETIYDLWAMGCIANIIGDREKSERYHKESLDYFNEVWPKEFMTITDQFALMRKNGLYQGTRWQYRWAMPVYMDIMIDLHGRETLVAELEEFFARNLFNQGNEPDIQTPFIFNMLGRNDLTQKIVGKLVADDTMVHPYGGNAEYPTPFVGRAFQNKVDGYALEMDEDDGAMSAWYMFAQLGFYPLCVGSEYYELYTPYFEKATIKYRGRKLTIRRKCPYMEGKRLIMDGKLIEGCTRAHTDMFNAKEIVFE